MRRMKIKKLLPFIILITLVFGNLSAIALEHHHKNIGIRQTVVSVSSVELSDSYDMVIISPEIFEKELQPLLIHKASHGVKTTLKTIEAIFDEYQGRDEAEKIKYFIKDAIEQWNVEYVLLVGGLKTLSFEWYVPVRYVKLDDGSGYPEFLSDLYFSDIYKADGTFEDWDSNSNGIFAEWTFTSKDVLDLFPDVAVGRLPCRNTREVKIIVNKIISYENTTYGQSWFNKMVAVGGNTFAQDSSPFPYEGEATCDVATSYMTGFDITRLYTSTGALIDASNVIDVINQGCGFFLTRGRGGTDRIRMATSDGQEFVAFSNRDIPKLSNKGMYPICVLGECIHAKFDVSFLNILQNSNPETWIPECIAWRLIRDVNGGGIAVLSNTNICYGVPGDTNNDDIPDDAQDFGGWLAVEFFRLYGQQKDMTLGNIYMQSLINYIDQFSPMQSKVRCKSIQEWILFGDPSLQIGGYS